VLIKKSLTIAGHRTSLALEAAFWEALSECAHAQNKNLSQIIAQIDQTRNQTGLASAVRVWVLNQIKAQQ